jgi:hypothetical protein
MLREQRAPLRRRQVLGARDGAVGQVGSGNNGGGGGVSGANPAFAPTTVVFPTAAPPLGDGSVTFTGTPDPSSEAAAAVTIAPRFTG